PEYSPLSLPDALPIFSAEDQYGNVDPTFTGSVAIALASNPGGATLGGTLTVSAVKGVATFSSLTIGTPGSGYTLQGSSAGLSGGDRKSTRLNSRHVAI